MKEITVILDEKPLVIKRLPLGKYVELLKSIKELPKHFGELNNKSNEEILKNLPTLISQCMPDIIALVHVSTGIDSEYIEKEMGIDELIDVVGAIFEVNNYAKVYEKIKKAIAHPQPQIKNTS